MTITDLMSVRFGISLTFLGVVLHKFAETVEQVGRIVRACCGLRVVLHGECGDVHALQAFDHVVVQIDVGDEHLAVLAVFKRRVDLLADRGVDREAVVVGGDLDLAGGQILDRLVDAAVAELELVGAEAECAAEQLVAKADAEERVAGVKYLAQQLDFGTGLFRSPGPLEKKTPSGFRFSISAKVMVEGTTCTRQPRSAMRCGVMPLIPRSTAATVYSGSLPSYSPHGSMV